jgi:hypothetical protein
MTSFRILSRLFLASLLTATASCADKITQAKPLLAESPGDPVATASSSGATPPTVVLSARTGTSAQLSDGTLRPPNRDGLFVIVEIQGAGFPAGADNVLTEIAVLRDGSKTSVGRSIGVVAADGSVRGAFGQSCPTSFREYFVMVAAAGRITESNHVPTGC